MRNLILASVALAACVAASPAAAGNVKFTLTSSDFDGALTWMLPQSPTPDFSDRGSFDLDGPFFGEAHAFGVDGYAAFGGFTFYTEDNEGGFSTDGVAFLGDPETFAFDPDAFFPFSFSLVGEQLFTGTTAAPGFRFGTFALHNHIDEPCGCDAKTFTEQAVGDYTLTIGAAVPEPASWALMIAGFGLAGTALRRRRAIAT